MVLLVFLVDTSASMNQKTCLGTSYLDLAKGAVESFLKIRSRDTNASRGDRYMLVTYAESNKAIKAGWRENLQVFMQELKNLEGYNLSNVGCALKETFDLLNMHRLQSGIDNYGMGRNPYYLEPALVLLLTDGCSTMDINGIIPEISIPSHNLLPGGELTKELFRWDQRLFTVNLKIPGFASSVTEKLSVLQPEDLPFSNLCELTGGKLYNVGSHKNLMQSLESIAQKIMIPGVIINFEKHGPDPEDLPKDGQRPITPRLENDALSPNPNMLMNEDNKMNGVLPHINGDISEKFEHMHNGFAVEPPQIITGPVNGRGLLPAPLMPPGLKPLMAPGFQSRGGLLPPPISGIIPPFVPNNKLLLPVKNIPPLLPPQINGNCSEQIQHAELKSIGLNTSSPGIADIPIRGDEQPTIDSNRNVVSPNIPSTAWQKQRRMIYVRTNIKGSVGHWPIPESFWPTSSTTRMPPRDSHPIVKFQCHASEAMVIDNMPFDKYELEPSPLTQYILERKQPNVVWQTFVSGSCANLELGQPFGYLKASTNLQCVNLFVMPYNYIVILPLLDELFKVHKCKPTVKWRQNFEEYLHTMPSYYSNPLRTALRRMGAPSNLMPDHCDGTMSYSVLSYLKKVKHQAKIEAERLTTLHSQRTTLEIPNVTMTQPPQLTDGKQRDFKELLIQKAAAAVNEELSKKLKRGKEKTENKSSEMFTNRHLPPPVEKFSVESFKNPFDMSRDRLLQQVNRMKTNFFQLTVQRSRIQDEDTLHRISISEMGNYQDHVNRNKPLREVDPSQARVHTFGNPFKLKQDQIIAVDEADVNENLALNQNPRKRNGDPTLNPKNKRKRSDTPPPSRRPVGPPNTPPPKIELASKPEPMRQGIHVNGIAQSNIKKETHDNKKNDASVNKQLRKLQQMHRNKKGGDKINETFPEKLEDGTNETGFESDSPILSILRTSLTDDKDDTNDEVLQINAEQRCTSERNSNSSSSVSNSTPVLKLEDLSPLDIRKARLQLQQRKVVKLRIAIWKAIRERREFPWISNLLQQLAVSVEAKYLFITNLVEEAEKFQLQTLCAKLKALIPPLKGER